MSISALVGCVRPLTYFFTRGRVTAKAAIEMTKNHTSCSHSGAWNMAAMSAASAPTANQIVTRPAVSPSMTRKITIRPIQMAGMVKGIPAMTIDKTSCASGGNMRCGNALPWKYHTVFTL
jgi:hypothetical protein